MENTAEVKFHPTVKVLNSWGTYYQTETGGILEHCPFWVNRGSSWIPWENPSCIRPYFRIIFLQTKKYNCFILLPITKGYLVSCGWDEKTVYPASDINQDQFTHPFLITKPRSRAIIGWIRTQIIEVKRTTEFHWKTRKLAKKRKQEEPLFLTWF